MFRAVILLAAIVYLTSTMAEFRAPQVPSHTQAICIAKLCQESKNECRSDYAKNRIADACTRQLSTDCVEVSKSLLSRFEQDDLDEMVQIARSCQYVYTGAQYLTMKNLSRFDRDDLNEVTYINSRLWLAQPSCIGSAISRLSRFDFDDLDDVRKITTQCTGTFDAACFERQCQSKWDCDDQDEVVDALRKCISGPSKQDRRRL